MRRGVRRKGVILKYIKVVTKPNGKRFIYYSKPGKSRVRLPDLPFNHADFLKAYVSAQTIAETAPRKIRAATGTIHAMIEAHLASDTFLALRSSTRGNRRPILDKIARSYGKARTADLRSRHIQADINKLNPHPANNRLKVWRGLCKWAVSAGLLNEDVSAAVIKKVAPKSDGHKPWAAEDISGFRDYWPLDTTERLAFELLYWTGVRSGDAIRLSAGMVESDGWLTFNQGKTGSSVSIPWSRELPEWADPISYDLSLLHQSLAARKQKHLTFITTVHGKARSVKSFSQWFSKAANKAGLEKELTAHGLRKARAIGLAELGATTHQIAAWTGHDSLSEVDRYSKKANRKKILARTEQKQKLETATIQFPI